MDILKKQDGYLIIEALVSLIILGFIVVFVSMFFNNIFQNPKILLRGQALTLANQEIERSINIKAQTDSIYKNQTGNLEVRRMIKRNDNLTNINVSIFSTSAKKEILSLSAYYKSEEQQ